MATHILGTWLGRAAQVILQMKRPKVFTRRKCISAVAIALIVILIAYVHGVHRVDPSDLDRTIKRQLPPGTDLSQVVAFLDSRGISHSEYVPEYHEMQAQIGRSRIGLGGGRIVIKFVFNSDRKLVSHTVREILDYL